MNSIYRFTYKENGFVKVDELILGNNPYWKYRRTIKFKNLHKYYEYISLIAVDVSDAKYYEGI